MAAPLGQPGQAGFWGTVTNAATNQAITGSTTSTYQNQQLLNQYYSYAQTQVTPAIDKLTMCAPGWKYIRWMKPENDDAYAVVIPIMALTTTGASISYVLGEATPSSYPLTPFGTAQFLAVLSPDMVYDEAVWNEKARQAYYNYHANEVAQHLLKAQAGMKAV